MGPLTVSTPLPKSRHEIIHLDDVLFIRLGLFAGRFLMAWAISFFLQALQGLMEGLQSVPINNDINNRFNNIKMPSLSPTDNLDFLTLDPLFEPTRRFLPFFALVVGAPGLAEATALFARSTRVKRTWRRFLK